jgi:hypothetical protein
MRMSGKIKIFKKVVFIVLSYILFTCTLSHAQEDSLKKADSANKANALHENKKPNDISKSALTPSFIQVRKVYNYNSRDTSQVDNAGMGDIIVVQVDRLDSLLQKAKAFNKNISLYINGREITDIKPISGAPDKEKGTLQYRLERNTSNNKIWSDILGAPAMNDEFFIEPVKISVGLSTEFAVPTLSDDNNFNLIRIHRSWFWTCCIMTLAYLIGVIYMAKKRGLLRDRGIDLSSINVNNNSSSNPYSLGRCQMAFWFSLTIVSFFFIWLITDAYNIITPTVLALIGISAGTSLSAAVIDNSKSTDLLNQTIALQDEMAKLNVEIPALQTSISTSPAGASIATLQDQLNTKQARALQIPTLIANNKTILTQQPSKGFLNDILQDANGISFHRLQMLVWTFVLGLIFIYSVWKGLSMPDFDATLLALQGLTAGTYLGFKFPEK